MDHRAFAETELSYVGILDLNLYVSLVLDLPKHILGVARYWHSQVPL